MLIIAAASLIFVLDVASKCVVRRLPQASCGLMPGLQVTRLQLVRAVFLRTRGRAGLVLTWLIAVTCVVILAGAGVALDSTAGQIGAGAALGGALGNLVDVLRRQAITDFLDLGWWPVFNLADVAIVGGLVLALWPMV